MYLYELQASAIDKDLEDTAMGVKNAGAQGPNGPMDDPDNPLGMDQEPNAPDPGLMSDPSSEELEVSDVKKIDSYVIAAVKNHAYVTDYRHRPQSKTEPFKLIGLEIEDLKNLRQLVRHKIGMDTFKDQFGLYSDPGMKFYHDLIGFVEEVIRAKQIAAKDQPNRRSETKKAKFARQAEPKAKPGKVRKPNRGGS